MFTALIFGGGIATVRLTFGRRYAATAAVNWRIPVFPQNRKARKKIGGFPVAAASWRQKNRRKRNLPQMKASHGSSNSGSPHTIPLMQAGCFNLLYYRI